MNIVIPILLVIIIFLIVFLIICRFWNEKNKPLTYIYNSSEHEIEISKFENNKKPNNNDLICREYSTFV